MGEIKKKKKVVVNRKVLGSFVNSATGYWHGFYPKWPFLILKYRNVGTGGKIRKSVLGPVKYINSFKVRDRMSNLTQVGRLWCHQMRRLLSSSRRGWSDHRYQLVTDLVKGLNFSQFLMVFFWAQIHKGYTASPAPSHLIFTSEVPEKCVTRQESNHFMGWDIQVGCQQRVYTPLRDPEKEDGIFFPTEIPPDLY